MPKWTGVFEEATFAPNLKPGYHRVAVVKVIDQPDRSQVIVILGNPQGEVAEFLPYDIRPKSQAEKEKIKAVTGYGDKAWLFPRFVGAFDYPSREWWEKELKDREPLDWDTKANAEAIMGEGRTAIVQTSDRVDKNGVIRAQVESYWGPEEDSRKPAPISLGVGESEFFAPKEPVGVEDNERNEEVPF